MSERTYAGGGVFQKNHLKTLAAIKAFQRQKGHTPSLHELMGVTGNSESTIQRHLGVLVTEGYIYRQRYVTRGIVLTGLEPTAESPVEAEKPQRTFTNHRSLFKRARRGSGLRLMKLPKLSQAEQAERIEMVARKAEARDAQVIDPNFDVVRGSFGHRTFRHLGAIKVG